MFLKFFDAMPRRVLALTAAVCVVMLAFGLYLQHVVGLEPCPMCIVQRYALVLVAIVCALTAFGKSRGVLVSGSVLTLVIAGFGAFVAARQSFLQWYPPEISACGRDFYGIARAADGTEFHFRAEHRVAAGDAIRLGVEPGRVLVFAA